MQTEITLPNEAASPLPTSRSIVDGTMRAENVLGVPVSTDKWNGVFAISPMKAAALLECRMLQRPLRAATVAYFADALRTGRFRTTHQGIAFNARGELFDGQHRLSACVEAKTPITVQAFFNQDERDYMAYDRGAPRNVADDLIVMDLAAAGVASVLQAAGKILFHFEAGRVPWVTSPRPTADDIAAVCNRHPHLVDACNDVYRHRGSGRLPPAPTAAFFSLFREIDEKQALLFLEQVRHGVDLDERSPALVIRGALAREGSRKSPITRNAYMIRLVHGWNAFRARRKVASLLATLKDGKFPEISGLKARNDAA